ncbi:hypothetical protein AA0Y32_06605 [Georgenia phoenicis]|uniref:hypothetical protein n=1 Tax=unclassified Georgenia TaxID=2626815 RepID=UPI0039B05F0F
MGRIVALPARGEVVADVRGGGRALRVSWHHDAGVAVLSLWHGDVCTGTVRVAAEDVPALVAALTEGLAAGYEPAARSASPTG